jgi:membrane protease YdiL (CAAX protease family)
VVGVLCAVNLATHLGPANTSLVLGVPVATGLIVTGRWWGLSWEDFGLARHSWRTGARYAVRSLLGVGAFYVVAVLIPATRSWLLDPRDDLDLGSALLTALVLIPLRTVIHEEVAFRGVLWALLRRDHGTVTATVVSSALFGAWHILPAMAGSAGPGQWRAALGTVVFTALAGVVFCELRRRSGSLLAPAGLHWATNGLGVLASAAVSSMAAQSP